MAVTKEQIRSATRELAKAIGDVEPRTLRQAGLVYVNDEEPGFRRRKAGKHFIFFDTRRQASARQECGRAHPPSRHSTGVHRCVDLQPRKRPSAGDRPRRSRTQTISLSRRLAQGARCGQVREARRIRRQAAGAAAHGQRRSESRRTAAPQSAGRGRAFAAALADPRWQRGIFARERIVRIDDVAKSARQRAREAHRIFVSRQKVENSTPSNSTTIGWRA